MCVCVVSNCNGPEIEAHLWLVTALDFSFVSFVPILCGELCKIS